MKNRPIFILGLFAALAISFGGIVLGSHAQLGNLTPFYDDAESLAFPQRTAGLAVRGQQVYADLGCAACHTQQVRRPSLGSDKARGWGERQSVARDYIHQRRPQLGASRLGPDLANFATRKPTEENLYRLLLEGSATHPSYEFLFERRKVAGERSARALGAGIGGAVAADVEVVPTEREQTLVSYLMSLSTPYDYPEARPLPPAKAPEAAGAATGGAKVGGEPKK